MLSCSRIAVACVLLSIGPIESSLSAQTIPAWQTAAGTKMSFEVASVKRAAPDAFRAAGFPLDDGDVYAANGGRFSAIVPLTAYIVFAHKLSLTADQRRALISQLPKWA